MQAKDFASASMIEPGDSSLEFFPLLEAGDALVVTSPQNLTTAIRALMIDAALKGGMQRVLHARLFVAQEKFAEEGGFWPLRPLGLSSPDRFGMRQSICQHEPGRYLHVIQVTPDFDGFPDRAFGSIRELPPEALKAFVSHIENFWAFAAKRGDRRSTMTIVLMGGWGSPFAVTPDIDEIKGAS